MPPFSADFYPPEMIFNLCLFVELSYVSCAIALHYVWLGTRVLFPDRRILSSFWAMYDRSSRWIKEWKFKARMEIYCAKIDFQLGRAQIFLNLIFDPFSPRSSQPWVRRRSWDDECSCGRAMWTKPIRYSRNCKCSTFHSLEMIFRKGINNFCRRTLSWPKYI